jgi:hypothetical protein
MYAALVFLLPTLLLLVLLAGLYTLASSAPTHVEKQADVEQLAVDANRIDFGLT